LSVREDPGATKAARFADHRHAVVSGLLERRQGKTARTPAMWTARV
jgi:hypothetical protein